VGVAGFHTLRLARACEPASGTLRTAPQPLDHLEVGGQPLGLHLDHGRPFSDEDGDDLWPCVGLDQCAAHPAAPA